MSSHHIIRDNQEPALFFLESGACDEDVLQTLLEWSPFVVATDESVSFLLKRGIKVDAVLGDVEAPYFFQPDVDFYLIKGKGLIHMLDWLEQQGHIAVNLIAAFDQVEHNLLNTVNKSIVVIDQQIKWSLIASGKVRKWCAEHTPITVRSKEVVTVVGCWGEQLINNEQVIVKQTGLIRFESSSPFWLGECIT